MTKTIAVLSSSKSKNFPAIKEYFKDKDVEVYETENLLEAAESDLCVLDGFKGHLKSEVLECTRFIKIHPSLLPSFACENAIEKAFEYGVKVSGVTVNYIKEDGTDGKIIAQYPVFIDSLTTFDEFEQEIEKVSQKLSPFVIASVLDDVIFSFDMLLKPQNCENGCKNSGQDGCSGCGK